MKSSNCLTFLTSFYLYFLIFEHLPWSESSNTRIHARLYSLIQLCHLFFAYRFYGKFLTDRCKLDDEQTTPAFEKEDGVDYSPTRASVLFGHHFSPLRGLGRLWDRFWRRCISDGAPLGYGSWWGAILVGGVHDFGSTLMSVRNGGRSIADTMRGLVGEGAGKLFMVFVVLALVYVIIVFLDLTANTLPSSQRWPRHRAGFFIGVAVIFGFLMRSGKFSLGQLALIFFPLTFAGLAVGHYFPMVELDKSLWIWLTPLLLLCRRCSSGWIAAPAA